MVAQISAKLAEAGLNIVSRVNKSLENIAYTVIDVNNEINEMIIKQISEIEGVVKLRTINSPQ
jgi:D-3-phosphoglycerate dehydrogenase